MRCVTLSVALAAVILAARPALAQQPDLPKWDAGASFGLLFGNGWHPDTDDYGEPHAAYHLELGRFWTTHLKTDTAIILTHARHDYDYALYPVQGVANVYVFTDHDRRLTAVSVAATYQFFENAMMHPFVSAGAQFGVSSDHMYRERETYTINRISYTVPALDTRTTTTLVRPFVAVGAKSYFNERTFIKSEFALAAGSSGISHGILRLGFGFDF